MTLGIPEVLEIRDKDRGFALMARAVTPNDLGLLLKGNDT